MISINILKNRSYLRLSLSSSLMLSSLHISLLILVASLMLVVQKNNQGVQEEKLFLTLMEAGVQMAVKC
jgi:hypothetical protein